MNILELIRKKDANVAIQKHKGTSGSWVNVDDPNRFVAKIIRPRLVWRSWLPKIGRDTVRGLLLPAGSRLVVRRAAEYWPDAGFGKGRFTVVRRGAAPATVSIGWKADAEGQIIAPIRMEAGDRMKDINVPSAVTLEHDLVIEVSGGERARVFLGVHRLMDRSELLRHCKGHGVEIGPGPKPQVRPGLERHVTYVEQATPDQWRKLYANGSESTVDASLWDRYVVGEADSIPAEKESLDFIFSSHVVEHLANPLGHLSYWASLLRPNGVVAAVIPDRDGCKDYVFPASTLEELEQEYRSNVMQPQVHHYRRWAAKRAPGTDPEQLMKAGRSIHVHFYTPASMRRILEVNFKKLGFREYTVYSEPNHKDFYVLLRK